MKESFAQIRLGIGAFMIFVGLMFVWMAPEFIVHSWWPDTLKAHPLRFGFFLFPWGFFIAWCAGGVIEAEHEEGRLHEARERDGTYDY